MDLLQGAEEGEKWGPPKVGNRPQACEQALVQDFLEMPLTDVLEGQEAAVKTQLLAEGSPLELPPPPPSQGYSCPRGTRPRCEDEQQPLQEGISPSFRSLAHPATLTFL